MKKASASGSWLMYDTARGINEGNEPYLLLNSTDPEVGSGDYIDPTPSGFSINAGLNTAGATYIFLAIA